MNIPLIMSLMLPWFIGQVFCLIGEGLYLGASSSVATEGNIVNYVAAFIVPEERSLFSTVSAGVELFTEALPRVFMWDYSFFGGAYAFVQWLLFFVFTVPFIIGIVIALAQLAQGIFRR